MVIRKTQQSAAFPAVRSRPSPGAAQVLPYAGSPGSESAPGTPVVR